MFSFLRELSARHEALKERIHAFRIPLSPRGQRIMGFVYFCIPVIGGYYIMQAAIGQSHKNLAGLKGGAEVAASVEVREQNVALQKILESAQQRKNNK